MIARYTNTPTVRHAGISGRPGATWLALAGALLLAAPAATQEAASEGTRDAAGGVEIGGRAYASWQAYLRSDAFREAGGRCGFVPTDDPGAAARGGSADCSGSSTSPDEVYEPDGTTEYVIQVVVHVIRNSAATLGELSDQLVESQIQVLNEDFQAIEGTNGEQGHNGRIRFELATQDEVGNPTNGITRHENDSWFNDSSPYYNSIAWDPSRYLNIYTNQASGALGYVPFLPQNGPVGSDADRVVINWQAFGSPGLGGAPYHLGRTVTHEVGHYLGLHHTFQGNMCLPADPPQCYTTGDLICDTTSQEVSAGSGSCANPMTCATPDNADNYMDYADDICMIRFTVEQMRRMRCTLESYRGKDLYDEIPVPTETTSWGSLKNMFK